MPQSLVSLHVHLIFSTKNRDPFITADLAPRLFGYIGGITREKGSVLLAAGGMADHVHLLVSLGRESCVADLVRDVKSNSPRWVHDTFPDRSQFAWQAGYGAFAVSVSMVDKVRAYISDQERHHRRRTFQDEFREFLKAHEIAWDERYVWD
jgi:REP element-mobilizing transposase RayT